MGEDPDALIASARALRLAGEAEAALALLDRAEELGLGEQGARRAAAALERGWAHNARERWDEAHSAFAAAVAAAPDDLLARTWHGRALYNLARDDEAEAELRGVLERDPERWMAWSFLGDLCALSGRDAEAIAAFSEVIRLQPDAGYAFYRRGMLHDRAGDLEAARADGEAAARLHFEPDDEDLEDDEAEQAGDP
ncbi:MAG TPA: tetratricopeptide repeat protein [Kofleriaceae bacterium]|nr:tetratricopeptide repeat protein [Kofleriaceae bacterium]